MNIIKFVNLRVCRARRCLFSSAQIAALAPVRFSRLRQRIYLNRSYLFLIGRAGIKIDWIVIICETGC